MASRTGRRGTKAIGLGLAALFAVVLGGAWASPAAAQWTAVAPGGAGTARAQALPSGPTPVAAAGGSSVTVTWSPVVLSGGTAADGYVVRRYQDGGAEQAVAVGCAGVVTATSCVETTVPAGTWRYTVTARRGGWSGAEGTPSAAVTVTAATLTFSSSTTLNALPATLNGTVGGFVPGDALTFRLDSPTGAVLSGTPSTVSGGGTTAVTVTVPAGTTDDPHVVFAVGSSGTAASAAITVVDAPSLSLLEMLDVDVDGKVDRVSATFDETLAPYTAGTAPWTLTSVPSGGTLASVSVTGATATLEITEGAGAASTVVGSFRVALATSATGVRDANGHRSSFAATAPVDRAAPVVTAVQLLDNDLDGKVDRVTATVGETLASYTAGTVGWALANVPSGGSLASVSASGTTATLTITEGAGAIDTAVGGMTVGLTATAGGLRDAAGNLTAIAPRSPSDGARPVRTAGDMHDVNGNGKIDRVVVTFGGEPLAPYTAGTTGWTLTSAPSGATLQSVTVSGMTATLELTEGSGAATTAVGSFRVALAATAGGIRDAADNRTSYSATAPTDRAAPAVTAMSMFDIDTDGKVDRVTATFSESLSSTSTLVPWTLANVPSGGSLASVSRTGAVVTLTITEGAGTADTAVGSFTVALATHASGVRDAVGNQASFAARAPTDAAGPAAMTVGDTSGPQEGLAEAGDTLIVTFSEMLAAGSVPGAPTVTFQDPSGAGNDTLTISGITNGARSTGSDGYVTTDGATATFSATTAVSGGGKTITLTLGPCSGDCAGLAVVGAAVTFDFAPSTTLTDLLGLAAAGTRPTSLRLF